MDVPTSIELRTGETYTLKLQGLGTAGYSWEYTGGDGSVVNVAQRSASEALQTGQGEPMTGSLDEIFTIRALKPGQVTLHFVQRRIWEKQKPPLREHTIVVSVVGP